MLRLLDALVRIAEAVERQAAATERVALAIEDKELPESGDINQAAKILGVSPRTVERYRDEWIQDIHYTRQGSRITYNLALLRDWKSNKENPTAHERAIKVWQRSLLSNQKRRA
ncbi:MAG: helix-turn-helix domain-containing protein [Cyanobacteria bacterium J06627_3]